jgi:trk system potassium uptake protein
MRVRTLFAGGPRSALERARPYIVTAMIPIVVMAAGSLVLEYGFRLSSDTLLVLHWVESIALAGMMIDWPLRLLLARHRVAMLKYRWLELTIVGVFLLAVSFFYAAGMARPDVLALRTAHVAIVLNILLRLVELNRFIASRKIRPAHLLIVSFATLIAIGTGLLLLPAATAPNHETTFMDAFFTATSAVCVTGLTVVDTGKNFSPFGQYVILALIQLGGLGLMTVGSVFGVFLWRGLRLRESLVMREVVSHDLAAEIRRIVAFILLSTVLIEGIGAVLMMGAWDRTYAGNPMGMGDRLYYSLFHSVAAFCNAGFSLYGDNMVGMQSTWEVNLVAPLLIILGGLGFGVLYNLLRIFWYRLVRTGSASPLVKRRLTLQSKMVILVTVLLLVGGAALIFVFETVPGQNKVWEVTAYMPPPGGAEGGVAPSGNGADAGSHSPLGRSWDERALNAWFLSVSSRTAGFNTTDTTRLSPPTKFLTVILMFIGASPGSTGGGIKTVTLAVILLGIWSALRGQPQVQAFHRSVPWETVTRALALMAVSALWVAAVTTIICAWGLVEGARFTFLDVLFEGASAFGTVGLSTGITPLLTTFGRILIIITMFIGRVGPIALLLTMQGRAPASARYTYPPEHLATS